jgi:D-threo-aldose 1-dehydrogenase
MKPNGKQQVGRYGLEVTQMGLGGTTFGNLYRAMDEQAVSDTLATAYAGGIRYFDTAPLYGYGLSEERLGAGLSRYNRDELVISTKVGYTLVPRLETDETDAYFVDTPPLKGSFDYSRDAVLRSVEDSLNRLKTDRIEILLIHDPDEAISVDPDSDPYTVSHFPEVMEQTYPVLDELRAQQVVKAIGLGMNQWQMLCDFAMAGDFDCFLLAGRYTLLEQAPLQRLLPLCEERNIRIIVGGPYNSGILATGAIEGAFYCYKPAPLEILERTRQIEAVCARHNVALQTAALQFPFGHPAIATIIPGTRSVAELEANIAFFEQETPAAFWEELRDESLIHPDAPLPVSD